MVDTFPDPSFELQGTDLTSPAIRLGPMGLSRPQALGVNINTDPTMGIPSVRIRPTATEIHSKDPCTISFKVFYKQYRTEPSTGVEYPMVFRLTSDLDGGTIGVDASLGIASNYPDIDMEIPRFTFSQAGFGILKQAKLPGSYEATLTVRVWTGTAHIAPDGWLMLECGYYKDEADARRAQTSLEGDALVSVGRAALFPDPSLPVRHTA